MATETVLFSFATEDNLEDNATGANPYAGLVADAQGNLFGTTFDGGANGVGAIYELVKEPGGYAQQTLLSFAAQTQGTGANATGANPFSSLATDGKGDFYGTTDFGGANDTGVVYELTAGAGGFTQQTLFSFAAKDTNTGVNATGVNPVAGVTVDAAGNLYGTTTGGGVNGTGTAYELVPGAGGYTQQAVYSFAKASGGANATGANPNAGQIADGQGNLYGTTTSGGANAEGTVYELTPGPSGFTEQVLFTFAANTTNTNATGAYPDAGLIADAQGDLYGTTLAGGTGGHGAVYELVKGAGGYTEQVLFSFAATDPSTGANATGANPEEGLIADAKGDLFGTTYSGGANGAGTVYELVEGATGYNEQTLFSFNASVSGGGNATGANPFAGLIADGQGDLYGTTVNGGSSDNGTVFELTDTGFATPCYCTGTAIRVVREGIEADAPVETLRVGDHVVTSSGAHRPICWLGHRTIDCRRHPRPREVMPVRIGAHAFGPNRSARDLRVSPGHAICVDVCGEVLIPAGSLVNGNTIVQEDVARVTYWHVELEGGHDVILAENLPCESYLDLGNRAFFAEGHLVALGASPDAAASAPTRAGYCRPFQAAGPLVEAVFARLAADRRQRLRSVQSNKSWR